MIEKNKLKCNGCGACRAVCPSRAITMNADNEGFLYPQVDIGLCIQCGQCVKTCPTLTKNDNEESKAITAYAAQTIDNTVLEQSSSGGLFTEIATCVLEQKGVVFGAAFDEHFHVRHMAVEQISELHKLRGSKYVQSEIGDCYTRAEAYLKDGRLVLFTGTPCQIGGLLHFLGKEYDNLITQDIICHGVPSPMVWRKYIEYREDKAASRTENAFFRHKKHGWKRFSMQFKFASGTEYIQPLSEDLYMRSFLKNLTLRPSCYDCSFKAKYRQSDFTLADFWGVEHVCPKMYDNRGTSLIILHSPKARNVFKHIQNRIRYDVVNIEEALQYNSAMTTSVTPNSKRKSFINAIQKAGFEGVKKYLKIPFSQQIKKVIRSILK